MAILSYPAGGVYLAGGIPKRVLTWLADDRFMQAFANKGRFADLLRDIPVYAVVSRAALLGAVLYGFHHFGAA